HEVELDERRAAHAVDHHQQVAADGHVGGDSGQRHPGPLTCGPNAPPGPPAGGCPPRARPGSPWMPIPSPTSASPSSKVGLPAAGTMHELSATPKDRLRALTSRATAATAARPAPCSASAPAIFSTNTVAPVPRRPAVYSESCTATSSLITTGTTSIPSSPASSAAIWKFSTSPV